MNNSTGQHLFQYPCLRISYMPYILNTQTKEIAKVQSIISNLFHGVGATTTVKVVLQYMEQTLPVIVVVLVFSLT